MSAHRDPEVVADYAKNAKLRGLRAMEDAELVSQRRESCLLEVLR